MNKPKKKSVRGMTLIEVIIAILVFALLGMVLMGVGNATEAQQRSARKYNNRINDEGPVAEAQQGENACLVNNSYKITVSQSGSSNKVDIYGKMYSVEKVQVDDDGQPVTDNKGNEIPDPNNEKGNFRFIQVEKPTAAISVQPTTAPNP